MPALLPADCPARLLSSTSEYLAAFQKTVAMHEVFLMRLVSHPTFREDDNLQAFLEYEKDVSQAAPALASVALLGPPTRDSGGNGDRPARSPASSSALQLHVRGKSRREKVSGFFKQTAKGFDNSLTTFKARSEGG